jgi:hypothetical protein
MPYIYNRGIVGRRNSSVVSGRVRKGATVHVEYLAYGGKIVTFKKKYV